jgi:phospholipase C
VHNSDYIKWHENRAPTVFERLSGKFPQGQDWRVYWDESDIFCLTRGIHAGLHDAKYDGNFRHMDVLSSDFAAGDLPAYSFIQPRLILNHNDMHPPVFANQEVQSSLLAGEELVKAVYDAVRSSPAWMRTLFVITFDEHGGTYDHWPPPRATPPFANPPWPLEHDFRFDRFGIRVPTIFISPYVAPGTVVRASGEVPFDHTSMIATLCRKHGLDPLTDRDRAAPDIGNVLTLAEGEARTKTPDVVARTYTPISAAQAHASILSGFQKGLAQLAGKVLGKTIPDELHKVEHFFAALGKKL